MRIAGLLAVALGSVLLMDCSAVEQGERTIAGCYWVTPSMDGAGTVYGLVLEPVLAEGDYTDPWYAAALSDSQGEERRARWRVTQQDSLVVVSNTPFEQVQITLGRDAPAVMEGALLRSTDELVERTPGQFEQFHQQWRVEVTQRSCAEVRAMGAGPNGR